MDFLIKAAQLILSLSLLVVLHEFGHFIPAKLFKTRVEKFYLFFNPWFSIFKKKIGDMIKTNEDNNNVIFKQILDGLDKVDTKLDEKVYGKTEIKVEEDKEYKTFKDKYNA